MIPVVWGPALQAEYEKLMSTCVVNPNAPIGPRSQTMLANVERYRKTGAWLSIPWTFIAVVHQMEAGGRFDRHLHNGDPLGARTIHVPKGRPTAEPAAGHGKPYTWEESARDALINCKGLGKVQDWSIGKMLYLLEGYNGYGYRQYHPTVLSPYLWSYTNHYTKGKYSSDGHFDPNLVSQQLGAAVYLKILANHNFNLLGDGK